MLSDLPERAPDQIIRLMQMFQADPREGKIDLGVGVYKDATGQTPIFRAVKQAETQLLAQQVTKGYLPLTGDPAFHVSMRDLVLQDSVDPSRVAMAATPGGSSALRQLADAAALARPGATIWLSDPTWPNHPGITQAAGLRVRTYRYLDPASGTLHAELWRDLEQMQSGDVLLLHGCCHNPTGIDLSAQDWERLTQLVRGRNVLPLIDVAYLGFGDGVDADTAALRQMLSQLPEALVAVSGSKSFGLYRERVGMAFVVCKDAKTASTAQGVLTSLNRLNFGFPPDHGARVVTMILTDPALRADWEAELAQMRARLAQNRLDLAEAFRTATGSTRFDPLAGHRGMFSILGFDDALLGRLRERHAVYLVAQGRINVAGLTAQTVELAAAAIAAEL